MVAYIKSDLEFILAQIKISEAHAAGQPLFGPGGLVPAYNVSWGLRTVDGTYNNLLHSEWGAADNEFPEHLGTDFRPAQVVDMNGPAPGGLTAASYAPSNDPNSVVVDSSLRTISNLIVDQTLGNPAAILTALQRAGIVAPEDLMAVTADIREAYDAIEPLFTALTQAQVAEAAATAAAAANPDDLDLAAAALAAQQALANAETALDAARGALDVLLVDNGIELDGANVLIPNVAPDEGLSAPFNSWFTLFGQFFDHGLDLVAKGDSGTVFVPLQPDDPLYVEGSNTNFMVLTRATVTAGPDGIMGNADDTRPVNTTTSFVDQNQTYTSHSSHQVFLRQYELNAAGDPVATGKLIEGGNGGMATWANVKTQALMLGIELTDADVGNIPLLRTDQYGNFIPNADGYAQVITGIGADGIPNTSDDVVVSGTPGAPVNPTTAGAIRIGHAFLADIAHNAAPDGLEDGDTEIGGNIPVDGEYDDELLDAHFIAGDGRANENIGLTAVHHVFHSEHNRLVQHTKDVALATADLAFLNEWLAVDVAALPTTPAQVAALVWDGERLFQAAKFGTEMQYQHLVFEEFARKIQPNINVFVVPDGFDVTIDPSIVAEFAHVVYRFGHSMLTESIDRFDPNFAEDHIGLIEGFLNPIQFQNNGTNATVDADIAAGAIIRGMTRQTGNHIDEFVTSALRNNLLGLPLDLATINLARGRDTGVPSLNAARASFYEATNQDVLLKPYESWVDFAGHLKNEASIINFIAAYGTHSLITGQATIEGKRDAALTLITGLSVGGLAVPADAEAFLNGLGAYGAAGALGGLNNVDLWIGGLAEATMPFGGMLGSTFNFVFETQMESLQNGDRFYYLQRLDGLHLFGEMENNSFASLIMRNTDATHLPSDVFSAPGLILEVNQTRQFNDLNGDGTLESTDPTGIGLLTKVVTRDNPATLGPDTNYLRYTGGEHVVLGGTDAADILIAGIGDDTLFGDGGKDRLEGGFGNDIINGGAGDDIIVDSGGDDNIKGEDGNDVVHAGPGLDLVMGGKGQDFIFLGTDMGSEVFAGEGNDFIYGNKNAERILGNEGDDWIETGTFDGAPGDNFDEIFAQDAVAGHDVFLGDGGFDEFIAEGGDDIMVGSPGRGKMAGMSGWDWATYKDSTMAVDADFTRGIVFDENPTPPANGTLDAYESVEGLSGSAHNDKLTGADTVAEERLPFAQGGTEGYRGSALNAAGIARIAGLQAVLGAGVTSFSAGDIILGGDGSDTIMGRGGDDIIDGDKWLNVRIGVYANTVAGIGTGGLITSYASMTDLAALMFNGTYNPGQLKIIRDIKTDLTAGDIDIAKYQGGRGEYAFGATEDGQVIVTHAIEDSLDGTDKLRNIEKIQFATGNALNIIMGTAGNDVRTGTAQDDLILGLGGTDVLNGGDGDDILVGGPNGASAGGTFIDNFGAVNYNNNNGTLSFTGGWVESVNETTSPTGGDININGGRLRFQEGIDGGETIQRAANLAAFNSATVSFTWEGDDLDDGETVSVQAFNGTTWDTLGTALGGDSSGNPFSMALSAAQIGAHTQIRFVANGTFDGGENFFVDNFTITAALVETLNGGNGDDTYSFTTGDGNDVINEGAGGGAADRISILPTAVDPVTGARLLSALNASDNNSATQTGSLLINYDAQQVTVNGHYNGGDAQTGVERINFNDATFNGYVLTGDYFISRSDPNNRDSGGVNMSTNAITNAQQNFVAGEDGVNDVITGGLANDLIFGGTGDNDLFGGAGDDLLVGGSGNGDDDLLDGGLDADTMVGLNGNDTYIVDDLLDVVIEAAGANTGTDTVETEMAALSIEFMANVENLVYTGVDADPFVGTGNSLANDISGGDLNDTLSGLGGDDDILGGLGDDTLIGGAGADELDGGDGADNMAGGADNDVYFVDNVGDVVNESAADSSGVDRVESTVSYVLGTNVENLDLNGDENLNGTGNTLANAINGNDGANQLFGGGGNDTINGGDSADLIDGGTGDDNLSGGGGGDADIIIGGDGNDTIDVGSGNDLIRYTASNFGNDTINNFDAAGGSAASQDLIDLSALGVTGLNFGTRVTVADIEDGTTDDTLITVRNAAAEVIGTIRVEELEFTNITATDFLLAATGGGVTNGTTGNNNITTGGGNDTINALAGNDTVNAGAGNDTITGGLGTDTLNGAEGDDTFIWNANAPPPPVGNVTDGRDIVNGGTEGTGGDTFVLTGNTTAEAYTIYTRAAWDAIDGNSGGSLNGATEIVITRNGSNNAAIVAELREIEEIRINGVDPNAAGGTVAGDTFTMVGDFSGTSLRLNTVTIEGSGGNDTIDISALTSDHRVVFSSNGGSDTIVGTPRPQDVLEGDVTVVEYVAPMALTGNGSANVLTGGGGNDTLSGKGGADTLNGGAGNDVMDGGNGNDTFVFAADFGNDTIQKGFDANAKGGQDLLDLRGLGIAAADFDDAVVITDVGNDTLVTIGDDSILLKGVNGAGSNVITQSDFLLG